MPLRGAVDIGGTFTDVVLYDDRRSEIVLGKALSTPTDLIDGVFDGFRATGASTEDLEFVIHGSTVVVNALIQRTGARTALITTEGFRDVYEIGRVNRPDSFNLHFEKHRPLIPREMVFEVPERLKADGSCSKELDEEQARLVARRLAELEVEAVAVVFLHAYRNAVHEIRMGELLREELPGCFVTLSHEISREYREFERTSTTAANAFVGPLVDSYLGRLEQRLREGGSRAALAIMQSNGGVSDVQGASRQCVQMLESGPAGGVVGAIAMCEALGYREAIAFDMGGTTAKSAVIRDLTMPLASDYFLGGYKTGLPMRIPCIDIVEVGTGGGSIAWLDDAGGIHVGPQSAGAEPGPACYGRGGTDATITDATVALGHLAPSGKLFGGLELDGSASRTALQEIGDRIGLDVTSTAAGIISIAAAAMANSVRAVTTERGLDPRDFALFAYGGNGPLHISLVARELAVRRAVIPPVPAVFSALGMLMADVRKDVVQTGVRTVGPAEMPEILRAFSELETECEKALIEGAVQFEELRFERGADMRYVGQEHTVTVPVPSGLSGPNGAEVLKRAFDTAHEQRYGHSAPEETAQIVSQRVSAIGVLQRPSFARLDQGTASPPSSARTGVRDVIFAPEVGPVPTPVYSRDALLAGNQISGPAVVEEASSTTLLRPGDALEVDDLGNLILSIGEA